MEKVHIYWNWTKFCGPDDFIFWDPSSNDFGRCFEILCLQFPLLTLISITSAYYCGKQNNWVVRSYFEANVLRIRYLTSLLLTLVSAGKDSTKSCHSLFIIILIHKVKCSPT